MRKVRKVVSYVCTTCYSLFPSSAPAREHVKKAHPPGKPKPSTYRGRPTQAGQVLEAVRGGAVTAEGVSQKTRIPLGRVHALLSYHRRKGNVRGYTGHLKAAKK